MTKSEWGASGKDKGKRLWYNMLYNNLGKQFLTARLTRSVANAFQPTWRVSVEAVASLVG